MGNAIRMIHDSIPIKAPKLDMDPRMWNGDFDIPQTDAPPELESTQAYKVIFDAMKANGSMKPGENVTLQMTDDAAVHVAHKALMNNHKGE